jgi:hypothetical protein
VRSFSSIWSIAGLLLRSIGAVNDGQGTADSIDRLGQRLERADAINVLAGDGSEPPLERGGEGDGQ